MTRLEGLEEVLGLSKIHVTECTLVMILQRMVGKLDMSTIHASRTRLVPTQQWVLADLSGTSPRLAMHSNHAMRLDAPT